MWAWNITEWDITMLSFLLLIMNLLFLGREKRGILLKQKHTPTKRLCSQT